MYDELYGKYTVNYGGDKVGSLKVTKEGLMTAFECNCTCAAARILRLAVLSGNGRSILGVMMPYGDKLGFKKRYSKNDLRQMDINSIDGAYLVTEDDLEIQNDEVASAFLNLAGGKEPPRPKPEPSRLMPEVPRLRPESPRIVQEPIIPVAKLQFNSELSAENEEPDIPTFSDANVDEMEDNTQKDISSERQNENEPDWQEESEPHALFADEELSEFSRGVEGAMKRQLSDGNILLAVPFKAGEPFPIMPIFCFGESMSISGNSYLVFRLKDGNLIS